MRRGGAEPTFALEEPECVDLIITWNDEEEAFKSLGHRDTETGTVEWYDEPEDFNFSDEWQGAWCQALNAYLNLGQYDEATNETEISYHSEKIINPATAEDLTLYYWGPPLGVHPDEYWQGEEVAEKAYTFDSISLVLEDEEGTPILDTDSEFGTALSPLTTVSLEPEEMWNAWNQNRYYSWTSGPEDWNQFTTVINAEDEFMEFQPPLRFTYTHTTANDLNAENTHNGKIFSLEYDGFELRLPWDYDPDEEEWRPIINLEDDDLEIDETIEPPTLTYDPEKTDRVGAVPDAELRVIKGEVYDSEITTDDVGFPDPEPNTVEGEES